MNKETQRDIPSEQTAIIGRHPVLEALNSDRQLHQLCIQSDIRGKIIQKIIQKAESRQLPIKKLSKEQLDQFHLGNHQGVVLLGEAYAYATLDDLFATSENLDEPPFFVLLDGLEDPHNLGAILRTADAAGVHGVIIPKRRAVGVTPAVVKTAAGGAEHVKVAQVTNLSQTIDELKDRGVWVFGTDMHGEDYRHWNASGSVAIVIGSEGRGLSRLVKEKCDGLVTIPMKGHVQSLNASVAAALMMYEVARDR